MYTKKANVQYTFLNALYYSIAAVMVGYASVFLLDKGMNNTTIGLVLASSNLLAIFGQSFLASVLDKSKKMTQLSLIIILLSIIIFGSLFINVLADISLIAMTFLLIALYACSTMITPFINSLTFSFEQRGIILNYGVARGIGSAAYATMSLLLGFYINAFSPQSLPYFYIGLPTLTLFLVLNIRLPKLPEDTITTDSSIMPDISIKDFFKKYNTLLLIFVATSLLFFDQTLINSFLIHVVRHVGGDSASLGNALFIQAMVELPTLFLFSKFQSKLGNNRLLIIAAIFFSLKHILTFLAINMSMLYMVMTLQLLANGLFVPASVYFMAHAVEASDLNKGQALMVASITLGSVLAGVVGGTLYDNLSVPNTLLIGAIISTIGTCTMLFALKQHALATNTEPIFAQKTVALQED